MWLGYMGSLSYQLKGDDPAPKKEEGLCGRSGEGPEHGAALFQDLVNSPAKFDASRWADFYDDEA